MSPDLLLLADGRFPAGGHSWSAGVEAAVDVGDITDVATLERYLLGAPRDDRSSSTLRSLPPRVAAAWRALDQHATATRFGLLDQEYDARTPSPHLRATSRRLGRHFVRAARPIWSSRCGGGRGWRTRRPPPADRARRRRRCRGWRSRRRSGHRAASHGDRDDHGRRPPAWARPDRAGRSGQVDASARRPPSRSRAGRPPTRPTCPRSVAP